MIRYSYRKTHVQLQILSKKPLQYEDVKTKTLRTITNFG